MIFLLACTGTSSIPTGFDDAMPDWSLQSDMPVDSSLQRDDHASIQHLTAGFKSQLANSMFEGVLLPLDGLQGLEPAWEDEAANIARWGPDVRDGETVQRQLLITWNDDDSRDWVIQEDAGDGWVDVLEGSVEAGSTDGDSAGVVTAWFGDMFADDNPGPAGGAFTATYSDREGRKTVHADFQEIEGALGTHTEVLWYDVFGNGSGALDYTFESTEMGQGEGVETGIARARWTPDGGGRADLEVLDGDVTGTLFECWAGSTFQAVYIENSWDPEGTIGSPDACPPGLDAEEWNQTH